MSLSGSVWPVHFPPEKDEALSSWFTRLAIFHYQVPSTFFDKTVSHRRYAWKQDIDVSCSVDVIAALGKRCCQSEQVLIACTLADWRMHFDPYDGQSTALPRWVSPSYIRRNSPHHRGWTICPVCLSQNTYFKLFWRLTFYFACPLHKVVLIDECEKCRCPISTHKINKVFHETFPLDSLAYCHNCGFDLRKSKTIEASDFELDFINKCIAAVLDGYTDCGNIKGQYSHLYFQGIRLIAKAASRKKLRSLLDDLNLIKGSPPVFEFSVHDEIEFSPINQIRHLLVFSYWLTQDWPNRILYVTKIYNLFHYDWIKPRDVVPFWIIDVIRR